MTAEDVKRALGLQPHPCEGGWFAESYRAPETLGPGAFAGAERYAGPRRLSTAIYYLLEPGTFSEMHRLASDEIFHHYGGAPVEMLQLWPGGEVRRVVIGPDLLRGERPQVVVPGGVWQGSRLLPAAVDEDAWALLGCTVSPGFDYADYSTGRRAELTARYPAAAELIAALTHA